MIVAIWIRRTIKVLPMSGLDQHQAFRVDKLAVVHSDGIVVEYSVGFETIIKVARLNTEPISGKLKYYVDL
jgi:hypothetical protein